LLDAVVRLPVVGYVAVVVARLAAGSCRA
jgi:hypothetical protein